MSKLTHEQRAETIAQARRDYRFNLPHDACDRCATCNYRQLKQCELLDIAIADPYKSDCPLYEFDGIPF